MTDEVPSVPDDNASHAGRRRRRCLRVAKLTAFTLATWVAFCTLLEIAVRCFVAPPVRTYHYWLGTHVRPGADLRHRSPRQPPEFDQLLHYNRQGFRDVERAPRKAPGTVRIVVLGDSIVEARQVALKETFCALLEMQLNRKQSGKRYEVINFGTSGAGPLFASLIFRHMPTSAGADLVLMVCFPNDVADDLRFEQRLQRDVDGLPYRICTPPGRLPLPAGLKELLRTHSRAWSYFGATSSTALRRLRGDPADSPAAAPNRDDFFAVRGVSSERLDQAWKLVASNLRDLKRLANRRGARFALVAVPLGCQVTSRPEWEQGRVALQLPRGVGAEFQQHLAAIARKHHFPLLDLLDPFESAQGSLYFSYDGHLTTLGHRVAARQIAQWLQQAKLLDPQ